VTITTMSNGGGTITGLTQANYFLTGYDDYGTPLYIPSIDPAGIVFHGPSGHIIFTDSEINEVPEVFNIIQANIFEISPDGTVLYNQNDLTQYTGNEPARNKEPTGIAYCPGDDHFYVSNDDNDAIYRYAYDGVNFTAVDYGSTRPEGNDPEGITCDPATGRLYVIDGTAIAILIYTYNESTGFNLEKVLDLNKTAGDSAGIPINPEGITFDEISGHIFLVSDRDHAIFEYNGDGVFINKYDLRGFVPSPYAPQGLSVGPSSTDPGQTSIYMVDAVYDNDGHPDERDGRIYEILIHRSQ